MGNQSLFQETASLFTARHIEDPIGTLVSVDDTTASASFCEGAPSIVMRGDQPVGVILSETLYRMECTPRVNRAGTDAIREVMQPLHPSCFVTPATTLIECIERFVESPQIVLVVQDGQEITGVVEYLDFFKPQGRQCLLALVHDLEVAAIDLLQCFGGDDECWQALPEPKTCRTFAQRYIDSHPAFRNWSKSEAQEEMFWRRGLMWHYLVAATTLTDKCNLIAKCKLTLGFGRDKLERVFARAARLKDSCVHPTGLEGSKNRAVPGPEIDREKFGVFITECRELIAALIFHTPAISVYSPRYDD